MMNEDYVMNVLKSLVDNRQMRPEDYKDFGGEIARRIARWMPRNEMAHKTLPEWKHIMDLTLDDILVDTACAS